MTHAPETAITLGTLPLEKWETLERLGAELDALEGQGRGDPWAMCREAELLTLAGAADPGSRARRVYPLSIEGPEHKPRALALAEQLTADALRLGDPRSSEYRAGCAAHLAARLMRYTLGASQGMTPCPYHPGTAAADAWFAGVERGRAVFTDFLALLEGGGQ